MSDIEQPAARSGQNHLLMRGAQHVGALRHEVHAAEDDELGVGMLADLPRELVRVAGVVGELDHLVALIVMAEDDEASAERRPWPRRCGRPSPRPTDRGTAPGSGWRSPMWSFSYSVRTGSSIVVSEPWAFVKLFARPFTSIAPASGIRASGFGQD